MRALCCCREDVVQEELWVERLPYGVIHKKGDVVAGKYTITGVFGQGAMGVTYEAERSCSAESHVVTQHEGMEGLFSACALVFI
jgi:hypothetical protein